MTVKKFGFEADAQGNRTILEYVRNTIVAYKGTVGAPLSLADVAKIARIEPITLVSNDLTGVKELYNILHGVLNIYAAYYLQAVAILSAELHDVRILKILDKTNPDRDIKTLLASGYVAYESYDKPVDHVPVSNTLAIKTLSLKGCGYKLPMVKSITMGNEDLWDEDQQGNSLATSVHKLDTFEKLGPAIGKVMDVKFSIRKENTKEAADEISIPVVVKLDTMVIGSEVIDSIIVANGEEITMTSRFRDAMDGRIHFIRDFLFASDLIKTHKRIMYKDNTNTYNSMLKRVNNSRIFSGLSGNISVAGVSSIIVMSESSEAEVAKKLGGRLTNAKVREMVFNNTMAMMIVVIDREWERVSIYIRDIDGYSQANFDSFKTLTDKGNSQVMDLFKAFTLGNAPSF